MIYYITLTVGGGVESARLPTTETGIAADIANGVVRYLDGNGSTAELTFTPGAEIIVTFYDLESGGDVISSMEVRA